MENKIATVCNSCIYLEKKCVSLSPLWDINTMRFPLEVLTLTVTIIWRVDKNIQIILNGWILIRWMLFIITINCNIALNESSFDASPPQTSLFLSVLLQIEPLLHFMEKRQEDKNSKSHENITERLTVS